jgi:hypothetical protein
MSIDPGSPKCILPVTQSTDVSTLFLYAGRGYYTMYFKAMISAMQWEAVIKRL